MEKPTAEDLARDAEADLAVCEAATAGPWKKMMCGGDNQTGEVLGIIHARPDLAEKYPPDQYGDIFRVDMVCAAWGMGASDIDFIAMSRTALPVWIRRAVAAEAFKQWVHDYLDAQCVPYHPPGIHGAEGCRIGDRMDWLMARLREALLTFARLAGSADIDPSEDGTGKTTVSEFVKRVMESK